MASQDQLHKIFTKMGFTDFRWIDPREIEVAQWVRMKCMFGCDSYGKNASCPPNTPSIPECRSFFESYKLGAVFHFTQEVEESEDRHDWTKSVNKGLLELEREVFIAGYHKAFMLFIDNCKLCRDCSSTRASCRNKKFARPSPESMGVDVIATVSKYGYPINVLPECELGMNRYAVLLLE